MSYRLLRGLFTVAVSLSAVMGSGCGTAQPDSAPTEDESSVFSIATACNQCNNCVLYARCKQSALPFGLYTYKDKLDIINSSEPDVGCVAVINTGDSTGHVAYVEKVSKGIVSISEGNWPLGRCGSRSGSAKDLKIVGYYCQ